MKTQVNSLTNKLESGLISGAYLNLSKETCKVQVKAVFFIFASGIIWELAS